MIGDPTNFNYSSQRYHYFRKYNNTDTTSFQPIIVSPYVRQNIIGECCGRIDHKSDTRIIQVPKFIPPSLGNR